jgi:hypothetical protein
MNVECLKNVGLAVAREQHLKTVMDMIVEGIGQEPDVALVRLWFLAPGDICAECYLRPECPDQTRCLHLVASAGHSLDQHENWTRHNGAFRRIPLGVGKIGLIGQSGESILIPDLSKGSRNVYSHQPRRNWPYRSYRHRHHTRTHRANDHPAAMS